MSPRAISATGVRTAGATAPATSRSTLCRSAGCASVGNTSATIIGMRVAGRTAGMTTKATARVTGEAMARATARATSTTAEPSIASATTAEPSDSFGGRFATAAGAVSGTQLHARRDAVDRVLAEPEVVLLALYVDAGVCAGQRAGARRVLHRHDPSVRRRRLATDRAAAGLGLADVQNAIRLRTLDR